MENWHELVRNKNNSRLSYTILKKNSVRNVKEKFASGANNYEASLIGLLRFLGIN